MFRRSFPRAHARVLGYALALLVVFGLTMNLPVRAAEPQGINHIGPIANDIIGITIRAGSLQHGRQQTYNNQQGDFLLRDDDGYLIVYRNQAVIGRLTGRKNALLIPWDHVVGQKVAASWADRTGSYRIRSVDDVNYRNAATPLTVYRKTKPTDLGWVGQDFDAPLEHVIYLKLPRPLTQKKRYVITFTGAIFPSQTFTYDPSVMRSEAVHVSHIGFRPDDPSKVAFVSLWMGSGGPRDFKENGRFFVLDDATGAKVFQGSVQLSKAASDTDEDVYNRNFNGTNVYMTDFSALKKPGRYRVYVEGVGCSYSFEIRDDAWLKAFYVSARGLYHQRSGIALGAPYTAYRRPRSFHPDDGLRVFASTTPLSATGNGLADNNTYTVLDAGLSTDIVSDAWGGYDDAGDWDRRIQHLDIARLLFDLADSFPRYFEGVGLNIPESGNGVPDIVNEAFWGIDFFRRLQTPEGAVRGGIESAGSPRYGEASWQESQTVMAYAPETWTTYLYAGAAARAAYWLSHGRDPVLVTAYRQSAVKAMEWAEGEYAKNPAESYPYQVRDARNLAAAELFRLSGEKEFHDIFLETTAFTSPWATIFLYMDHDQGEAAWVYYNTNQPLVDESVRACSRNAIIADADNRIAAQKKTGFKWTKEPYRPAFAGTFTAPDCISVVRAHAITGKSEYLKSVVLAAQTGAGANPLNVSYTTGIGWKSVQNILHVDSRVSGQAPPPGLTALGPIDIDLFGGWQTTGHMLAGRFLYPPVWDWPVIESYWDIFWYPLMNEFTVHTTIAPNAYVWGYLAARSPVP